MSKFGPRSGPMFDLGVDQRLSADVIANSLGPDQARQNFGPNCLIL